MPKRPASTKATTIPKPKNAIPVPNSPSNPPSPSSLKDVPLLRLDPDHHHSPTPALDHSPDLAMPPPSSTGGSTTGSFSGMDPATPRHNSHAMTPRERKQSNPLSQFRSTQSIRTSTPNRGDNLRRTNTPKTTGSSYAGSKGKSRYSDSQPGEDDVDLLGGSVGQGGRGESDGGYDEGWETGLQREEEQIGLLGGNSKVSTNP